VIDVYARLSRDNDGTTRSVDSQVEDCRYAVDEHADDGWVLGEVWRDHARSAWNPRVVREEWNRLMARLESGAADGVIVYDLTRFTRKPVEGERLIALAERGLVVASLENTYNLNDRTVGRTSGPT
jgi:site-specific DNA recombinase